MKNPPEYGDLTKLNKTNGILAHVGKETLEVIAKSYLDLLNTSSAIYELDGSYASALFSSSFCKFMDRNSRQICETEDDLEALNSGKWLCHESCWTDCSRIAIETGELFDLRDCKGGINIYAVPIRSEGEVIGAINIGYGNPPEDKEKLEELSGTYKVDIKDLEKVVSEYEKPPEFVVAAAKKNLCLAAELIGEIYTRKKNEFKLKHIAEELEEQLLFNKTITDNAASCLFMMDKQGHPTFMNLSAESVTGYILDEIKNKPLHDAVHYKYPDGSPYPMSECPIDNAQAKFKKVVDYEDVFVRKDGSLFPVTCYIEPLAKDGEVIGSVLEFQDITDRKKGEEKLRIAQKQILASQKLAGVGELAAGVSHEVLNPVNIISMHTQMLQRKTQDDLNIQNFCFKVMHEISRIQKIMGSLLAFSRKSDAELVKGHIRDAVEKVLTIVEKEYKLENIEIIRDWCGQPVEILFDADKVRQVYLNLVHNAKQAMPKGGTITVGCGAIKNYGKNFHQFTFSDTGTGMSEDVKSKIFEPFFTTKPVNEGTGMGLSVVHGIIEEHGGTISVESDEGKGTTFIISLPLA